MAFGGRGATATRTAGGAPAHRMDTAWGAVTSRSAAAMTGSVYAAFALLSVLSVATLCDVRTRRVPVWLSAGGIVAGLVVAAFSGAEALRLSLFGVFAGGLVFLPFVLRGWLGGADALLLATVGAWQGWRVALWAAWWTALAGGLAAIGVWAWRRHRGGAMRGQPFPYVPAIFAGTALALFLARW